MPDITVNLPDGSAKAVPEGSTVLGVAEAIGPRLAQAAIAGKVGGDLVDVNTDGRRRRRHRDHHATRAPRRSTSCVTRRRT